MSAMVRLKCEASIGLMDAADATFRTTVEDAHARRIHLLEALMVRDYIVAVSDVQGGAEARSAVLPLLGRAVAGISGGREELSAMLGAGLDAAAAEALL